MSKYLPVSFVCLIIAACSNLPADETNAYNQDTGSTSPSHDTATQPSRWVEYADAKADANLALAKGDTRMLAFANRVLNFPGVEPALFEKVKNTCGYRILPGTGDTLQQGQDMSWRTKLHSYAQTYNQLIYATCLQPEE